MDDLISRQAVNDLVDELARAISDERCCISRGRSTATIMKDILDLPSVVQPTDEEYILKSDAIRVASGYCHPSNIAKEIEKLPGVKSSQTGCWIVKDDVGGIASGWECSKCHIPQHTISLFCPSCGAYMCGDKQQ